MRLMLSASAFDGVWSKSSCAEQLHSQPHHRKWGLCSFSPIHVSLSRALSPWLPNRYTQPFLHSCSAPRVGYFVFHARRRSELCTGCSNPALICAWWIAIAHLQLYSMNAPLHCICACYLYTGLYASKLQGFIAVAWRVCVICAHSPPANLASRILSPLSNQYLFDACRSLRVITKRWRRWRRRRITNGGGGYRPG